MNSCLEGDQAYHNAMEQSALLVARKLSNLSRGYDGILQQHKWRSMRGFEDHDVFQTWRNSEQGRNEARAWTGVRYALHDPDSEGNMI